MALIVRRLAVIVMALAGSTLAVAPSRADPQIASSPVGRWLTQDHEGVIEITTCDTDLCGRIVGMDSPTGADGQPVVDVSGRPQCGLTIMRVSADGTGRWTGRITDPDSGDAWRCALWVDAQGRLNLRGYVLIPALGRTQLWTRFDGAPRADCRF
jgi:uncharacterized protein (DUF2147 family)